MRKNYLYILLLLIGSTLLGQNNLNSSALFVKNEGQWSAPFTYKLQLNQGAIFFEKSGYTCLLTEAHSHSHDHHAHEHHAEKTDCYAFKMHFEGSIANVKSTELSDAGYHYNYFIGNNPQYWRSGVKVAHSIQYQEIYPGININYYGSSEDLKYDIHLSPQADPHQIKMHYTGLQKLSLNEEGQLVLHIPLGDIYEFIPEAYQIIGEEKINVPCQYLLKGDTVSFSLGNYNKNYPLLIDPKIVFSGYSGANSNNFGFTATYDNDGNLYGGGIAFGNGYPLSTGAFQMSFEGSTDMAITKFSPDGSQLLYSTFLGGQEGDLPHSLVVNSKNELIILGNTGSDNFPMPITRTPYMGTYQGGPSTSTVVEDYPNGSDIIIAILSPDGKNLISSTYFGGSDIDGINYHIFDNYGDRSRGEVVVTPDDNICIVSNTSSDDIVLPGNPLAVNDTAHQNAIVAVFNQDLTQLKWASFFGGNGHDAGYSVKTKDDILVIAGATKSNDLPTVTTSINPDLNGVMDGYVAEFEIHNGRFISTTYIGSNGEDQVFLMDLDDNGDIYLFGQTETGLPITPDMYSNPGSRQFLQKLDGSASISLWSTVIGSGQNKYDLVPTALMVDKCGNIYLSGWNGTSNRTSIVNPQPRGDTYGLPITPDAFQKTTDGNDFYFMVLNRDASSLLYGSYFGGTSNEHVDGGTSRFSREGTIYQAVCASCGGGTFPTTPGVYSPSKGSGRCNLGVFKFDFEKTIRSDMELDPQYEIDTICDSIKVKFVNKSFNATNYFWDFGNGKSSTDDEPEVWLGGLGNYTIRMIAFDTVCGLADTTEIEIDHNQGSKTTANFEPDYIGCDKNFEAGFINNSSNAQFFLWEFGDGMSSNLREPIHFYADSGEYTVTMIAFDTICGKSDTTTSSIHFSDTVMVPDARLNYTQCKNGELDVSLINPKMRFIYEWTYKDGVTVMGHNPILQYDTEGLHRVYLTITDPLCNETYSYTYNVDILSINPKTFIPNAFTPNGDGINDLYKLFGQPCDGEEFLIIYNRWGQEVFYTSDPFNQFWDGNYNGNPVTTGVYSYILKTGEGTFKGFLTLFR